MYLMRLRWIDQRKSLLPRLRKDFIRSLSLDTLLAYDKRKIGRLTLLYYDKKLEIFFQKFNNRIFCQTTLSDSL